MAIPMPWSTIPKALGWVWRRVTLALLLKTYQKSHKHWADRHRLGARWEELGEHLEYTLYLAKLTDTEPRISKVAFRAKNQNITHAEMFFEATGGALRYQQKIILCDVDKSPIILNLINILMQQLIEASDRGIIFSVETVQFKHCILTLENGEEIAPYNSLTSHLSHNWHLNDEWIRQWDIFWNYNSIKWAKRDLGDYWMWIFGNSKMRIYTILNVDAPTSSLKGSCLRFFASLMATPWLLTCQFWIAIWSGLFILNDEDRLQRRWKKRGLNDD